MQRIHSSLLVALVLLAGACAAPGIDFGDTLLINARVIDGTGAAARAAAVRILDGRIVEVGDLVARDGEVVVDLEGLVLAPGFIDTEGYGNWNDRR